MKNEKIKKNIYKNNAQENAQWRIEDECRFEKDLSWTMFGESDGLRVFCARRTKLPR